MHKARDLTIKGDITAAEDITIDFAVDGSLELPDNRLVITEGAQLHATVKANSVVLRGQLDGHISADRLEIASSAVVNAGVVASHLALADGAVFSGPVNTERAKAAASVARHRQRT